VASQRVSLKPDLPTLLVKSRASLRAATYDTRIVQPNYHMQICIIFDVNDEPVPWRQPRRRWPRSHRVLDGVSWGSPVSGAPEQLTPTECDLLFELSMHATRVLSRDQLLQRIWVLERTGERWLVREVVERLRGKLGEQAIARGTSSPSHGRAAAWRGKAQSRIQEPAMLTRLVKELIDSENSHGLSADVKGDAYESLLERNAQDVKTGAGQYFTPRPLIEASDSFGCLPRNLPFGAGDAHALAGAHADEIGLELGEGGEDIEEHLAHGIVRVVERPAEGQSHAVFQKLVGDGASIWNGPGEAVEFGHDQGIAFVHGGEGLRLSAARGTD